MRQARTLLESANYAQRMRGLRYLAAHPSDPVRERAARLLSDPEVLVRVEAMETLVATRAKQACGRVRARLRAASSLERAYAAWALGRLGDASAAPRIERMLRDERWDGVRAACAEALWRLTGAKQHVRTLLAMLRSSDPEARAFTSNSLLGVATPATAERLIRDLRRAAQTERFAAIRVVMEENLETLVSMQRENDYELR